MHARQRANDQPERAAEKKDYIGFDVVKIARPSHLTAAMTEQLCWVLMVRWSR